MFEKLYKILDEEYEVYQNFLDISRRKKEALMTSDIQSLAKTVEEEKKLSLKLMQLENQRKKTLVSLGYKPDSKVAELIKTNISGSRDLSKLAEELKSTLNRCKDEHNTNMKLVRQLSSYVNQVQKIYTRNNKANTNATYNKSGGAERLTNIKLADMQG
jgi:hypothetical protein